MSTGSTIATIGRLSLSFGETLLTDIKPDRFARLPEGQVGLIPTNHPAWAYGHLGLYGSAVCSMLGEDEAAKELAAPEDWDPLFKAGATCQDDPEGSLYPDMKAITEQFIRSMNGMLACAERADDAVFLQTTPIERMRERFPTIGVAVTFMAGSHAMLHLGQVSAWRRIEGLGSAM